MGTRRRVAGHAGKLTLALKQRKEALAQQAATAAILKVIRRSPGDAQPVFDAIVRSALRLVGGHSAIALRFVDGMLHLVAHSSTSASGDDALKRYYPQPVKAVYLHGRAIRSRRPYFAADTERVPASMASVRSMARKRGYRSLVAVPMLRDGVPIGSIGVSRKEPGEFSRDQIRTLETFADEAVIAIENARLFNETKSALARQTSTAEILRVLGRSMTDAQPVFDAIVRNCHQLFNGAGVVLRLASNGLLEPKASVGATPGPVPIDRKSAIGTCVIEGRTVHLADLDEAAKKFPRIRQLGLKYGYRSGIYAPLTHGGKAIGAIGVLRRDPGAFDDEDIQLLNTFADQAVIAIENVRLFNETKEALGRQTAMAEILKVISASPTDVQPVFDAIAERAAVLCGAKIGVVTRFDGELLHLVAFYGASAELVEPIRAIYPLRPGGDTTTARAVRDRAPAQIPDLLADPDYVPKQASLQAGYRSNVAVPLLRDGKVIGAISVARAETGVFSEKEIGLLRTFADQAVIAIENVRLFNETKEALEQQTATARILGVMSSSPTDVQPVLDAVAETAARLCETYDAIIRRVDPDGLRRVAHFGPLPATPETEIHPLAAGSVGGRAVLERRAIHVEDIEEEVRQGRYPEAPVLAAAAGWYRSMLAMPLIREDAAIGVIMIRRKEYRPFTGKQIALLKTFADQAVIAIENVRLFNETKEALERQTATAEILEVIASSPSDVQPVFDAIAASARRLLDGGAALVAQRVSNHLELVAYTSTGEAEDAALRKLFPTAITGQGHLGKAILSAAPVGISDIQNDESYSEAFRAIQRVRGLRSVVSVPMLREGKAIGVISVNRPVPGKFSEHQTNLLKTFADQAVIAIENVRLFKELQAQTEALTKSVGQLTALGEVGQAISSSLELETVLTTIVTHAVKLSGLDAGLVYEYDEARDVVFDLRASEGFDEESLAGMRATPVRPGEGAVGRAIATRAAAEVPDTHAPNYPARLRQLLDRQGFRAILAVPLMREEQTIGALMVLRKSPGAFAPEIVGLLGTLATQSALAIQNARLFREIAEKGQQLEVASQHKSQFLASMSHELRTPLNALLGFNEMLLGDIYGEVPVDMRPPLAQMQSSGKHLLRLINNVLDLAKIEAGRMELALAEYSVHDTVESVRSTLQPLAAEKGLDFLAAVPGEIPLAYGDPGRITQCLMNLAGNSLKFTKAGKVEISVAMNDGLLRYRVADTGIGIPPDKIEGLFTEFKQTDATVASEYGGTGLGLSISKKFVEMHGGRIWAESEPGRGSVFTFEVPLRAKAA